MLQIQKFLSQSIAKPEDARQICFLLISRLYGFDSKIRDFFIQWFGREYTSLSQFDQMKNQELVSWLLHLTQGIDHYSHQYMTEIYRYKVKKPGNTFSRTGFRNYLLMKWPLFWKLLQLFKQDL